MYNYQTLPNENFNKNQQFVAGNNLYPQLNTIPQNLVYYPGQPNYQNNHTLNMNLNPQPNMLHNVNNMGNFNLRAIPYEYISSTKCFIWANSILNFIYILSNSFFIFQRNMPFYDYGNVILIFVMIMETIYYLVTSYNISSQTFTIQNSRSVKSISGYILILYILSFVTIVIFTIYTKNISDNVDFYISFYILYSLFTIIYWISRLITICIGRNRYRRGEKITRSMGIIV